MDVRFYPAPPANVGSCSLPTDPSCLSSLDYYHPNKARYSVAERGVRLHTAAPSGFSSSRKRLSNAVFDADNMYMNDSNQDFRSPNQSFSSQGRGSNGGSGGGGDEDYEIPPITPPNHADPSLLHLMEHESGYPFHSLPHNGLLNTYSYPELPALMMSNMLGQDTHLLSGPMHSISGEKRPSAEMMKPKPKPQKKKKKKDPNEPQKPVSAYALFFRDTQAAIKGQNPNATFGDVSKIVASMWDSLGEEQKQTYNDPEPKSAQQTSQPSHLLPPKQPLYSVPPQPSSPYLGPTGTFPLSELQSYGGPPRHSLAPTLSQSQMLPPSMSASPPTPFQISPPLHPHAQLSLNQSSLLNQPIRMQQSQPIISHQMGLQASLHSPPLSQQGFSHLQADYQNSVGGSQSPGAANSVHGQNHDWDSEYCNRDCGPNHCSSGMGARDKPLYLT
uniref:TOX high mobility group box family member 2 n=1 Tax=Oryzias melastigma TaxID=30732 RepID=A0A3B3D0I8_ORYME